MNDFEEIFKSNLKNQDHEHIGQGLLLKSNPFQKNSVFMLGAPCSGWEGFSLQWHWFLLMQTSMMWSGVLPSQIKTPGIEAPAHGIIPDTNTIV